MIEAALASPRVAWRGREKYPDLPAKAAALLYAFAKIQPCVDGNKRLALLLVDAFVELNGGMLDTAPGDLSAKILEVSETAANDREFVLDNLTAWFQVIVATTEETG